MRTRKYLALACGIIAEVALTSSCFSERTTVTGVDAGSCNVQLPSEAFGSSVVIIRNFAFSPSQLHIKAGTKVTWVNCGAPGSEAHTSTADAGSWRSPVLAAGATFTTQPIAAGSYAYHCELHPSMKGSVTVE
jgi:plastocyanin